MVLAPLWPQPVANISPVQQEFQEQQHKNDDLTERNKKAHIFKKIFFILGEVFLQDDKCFKLSRILLIFQNKVSLWWKMLNGNYPGERRGSLWLVQDKGKCSVFSHRSSKLDDNYLKELNEDLKLRKQELLEILKPLEAQPPRSIYWEPGGLQSTGLQNAGHNLVTEQQQSIQWVQMNGHQPNYRDSLGLHGQYNRFNTRSTCRTRFFSWVTGYSSILNQAVENEYTQHYLWNLLK